MAEENMVGEEEEEAEGEVESVEGESLVEGKVGVREGELARRVNGEIIHVFNFESYN